MIPCESTCGYAAKSETASVELRDFCVSGGRLPEADCVPHAEMLMPGEFARRRLHFSVRVNGSLSRYKVCFCDSHLTNGEGCTDSSQYKIEVGHLHASGVSPEQITRSQWRSSHCHAHVHSDSMSCYRSDFANEMHQMGGVRPTTSIIRLTNTSSEVQVNNMQADVDGCFLIRQHATEIAWWKANLGSQHTFRGVAMQTDSKFSIRVSDVLATDPFEGLRVFNNDPRQDGVGALTVKVYSFLHIERC